MSRKQITIIRHIILIISLLCLFAAIGYLLLHYREQQLYNNTIKSIRDTAYIPDANEADLFAVQEGPPPVPDKKTVTKKTPSIIDFQQLYAINKDICAWLKIPETGIDYPILYHAGDNEYYLHRDLNQNYSSYGSLFFARGCIPIQQDTSLLVYGHHMKDGSMFAGLMRYKQKEYYANHSYIHLYTPEYNYQYQVAAVILTDISNENPDALYCDEYIDMSNPATMQEFSQKIEESKLYNTGISLLPGDQLLMLSTCEYSSENGRLVVIARQTAKSECD